MSSIGTGYDLSASQFSPDGRVFQIDYACKAVEKSGTVIGLRGKDCVILAIEKIITSPLFESDAGSRIFTVDKNIGIALAGLLADGRQIVDIARQEAANYRQQFERTIPLKHLCERISSYVHAYTLYSAVRPFGVCAILSAWDEEGGSQLYKIEPSGTSFGYYACASGKAEGQAKTEMEKMRNDLEYLDIEELVKSAGKIIYTVHDDVKDKSFRFELSIVGKETGGLHRINLERYRELGERTGVEYKTDDDGDDDDKTT